MCLEAKGPDISHSIIDEQREIKEERLLYMITNQF